MMVCSRLVGVARPCRASSGRAFVGVGGMRMGRKAAMRARTFVAVYCLVAASWALKTKMKE